MRCALLPPQESLQKLDVRAVHVVQLRVAPPLEWPPCDAATVRAIADAHPTFRCTARAFLLAHQCSARTQDACEEGACKEDKCEEGAQQLKPSLFGELHGGPTEGLVRQGLRWEGGLDTECTAQPKQTAREATGRLPEQFGGVAPQVLMHKRAPNAQCTAQPKQMTPEAAGELPEAPLPGAIEESAAAELALAGTGGSEGRSSMRDGGRWGRCRRSGVARLPSPAALSPHAGPAPRQQPHQRLRSPTPPRPARRAMASQPWTPPTKLRALCTSAKQAAPLAAPASPRPIRLGDLPPLVVQEIVAGLAPPVPALARLCVADCAIPEPGEQWASWGAALENEEQLVALLAKLGLAPAFAASAGSHVLL